jgi:hypothetical protein
MKQSDQKTAEGILFTDQYQLTMAQLYYRLSLHEKQVQFDHFFRDYPDYGLHQAGYYLHHRYESLPTESQMQIQYGTIRQRSGPIKEYPFAAMMVKNCQR